MTKKPYIDYEDDESELFYPESYCPCNRRVGMPRRMKHKTKAVTENGMRRLRARQLITHNP